MHQQTIFTRNGFYLGIGQTLPVAISGAAYGVVFGVLARQAGLSWLETILMSALVNAGGSQFVVLSMWFQPLPTLTIILSTLIINLRHLLMGASLFPWIEKLSTGKIYSLAFFISDESWALAMREFAEKRADAAFLLGSGMTLYPVWVVSSVVGNLMSMALHDPAQWGLDFAFTAVFTALLVGMWKDKSTLMPWLVSAVVALIAFNWLPGKWYIILGGLAGSTVGGMRDGS